MCLGVPGLLQDVREQDGLRFGKVKFAGISRDVCLEYVPEAVVGDYVLVHVGFAISTIDAAEAEATYRILEEIGQTDDLRADMEEDDGGGPP